MADIQPIVMPKWGLAMQEGTLAKWSAAEGDQLALGQEIMDIETSKIANVFESPVEGVLSKRVAQDGEVLPVGALLAVVADTAVPDARHRGLCRRVPGEVRHRGEGRCRRAGADPRRDRRQARALPRIEAAWRAGGRDAGAVHPRLRLRPRGLAVQPHGGGRKAHRLCRRPARPWRLGQGGRRRLGGHAGQIRLGPDRPSRARKASTSSAIRSAPPSRCSSPPAIQAASPRCR